MKKLVIIGLALALVIAVSLAGCGTTQETTTTTVAPATTTTTGAAAESTTTTAAETTTTVAQEPIEIKFASHYQQAEPGGEWVQKFCDYVTEKTNGAVKFNIFFGGTLGAPPEELDLVSSGSVGMTVLGHLGFADQLPLLNFPGFLLGSVAYSSDSTQAACAYFDTLVFDNPTTSALIQDEAMAKNIKYLGFTAGGEDVFLASFPFAGVSDFVGHKFGMGGSVAAWESLGLSIVSMVPPEAYEDLQRGVVDCTEMGFAPTVANKWYEVAKYYMWDGMYGAGNPFTINLDVWNKLTPATQQIFMDAGKECETYSVQLTDQQTTDYEKTLTDAGVSVGAISDADAAAVYTAFFKATADDMYGKAKDQGITDNMVTVLTAAAQLAGQTWTPPTQ